MQELVHVDVEAAEALTPSLFLLLYELVKRFSDKRDLIIELVKNRSDAFLGPLSILGLKLADQVAALQVFEITCFLFEHFDSLDVLGLNVVNSVQKALEGSTLGEPCLGLCASDFIAGET